MMETLISSVSTNPLLSSIITLYTLILVYFPTYFVALLLSPLLTPTFVLLLSILRLGAAQEENLQTNQRDNGNENSTETECTQQPLQQIQEVNGILGSGSDPDDLDSLLEWDVRAPLEVIYEAYEGEEGEEVEEHNGGDILEGNGEETQMGIMERYASLSMYYPETETDTNTSSSEGDFPVIGELDSAPEDEDFGWEEEDGEGMIEIALDGKRKSEFEEENLIEIDFLRLVSRPDDVFLRIGNDGFPHELRYN